MDPDPNVGAGIVLLLAVAQGSLCGMATLFFLGLLALVPISLLRLVRRS